MKNTGGAIRGRGKVLKGLLRTTILTSALAILVPLTAQAADPGNLPGLRHGGDPPGPWRAE
jgi:hypothetical protein